MYPLSSLGQPGTHLDAVLSCRSFRPPFYQNRATHISVTKLILEPQHICILKWNIWNPLELSMSPCLSVDKLTLDEPPQSMVWPKSCVEQILAPLRSGQEIPVSGMPSCMFHSSRRSGFHCQAAFHLRGKKTTLKFLPEPLLGSITWAGENVLGEGCEDSSGFRRRHSQLSPCMRYIFRWSLRREPRRLNRWASFSGKTYLRWEPLMKRLFCLGEKKRHVLT